MKCFKMSMSCDKASNPFWQMRGPKILMNSMENVHDAVGRVRNNFIKTLGLCWWMPLVPYWPYFLCQAAGDILNALSLATFFLIRWLESHDDIKACFHSKKTSKHACKISLRQKDVLFDFFFFTRINPLWVSCRYGYLIICLSLEQLLRNHKEISDRDPMGHMQTLWFLLGK